MDRWRKKRRKGKMKNEPKLKSIQKRNSKSRKASWTMDVININLDKINVSFFFLNWKYY